MASKNAPENRGPTQVKTCQTCNVKMTPMLVVTGRNKKMAEECQCGIFFRDGNKMVD